MEQNGQIYFGPEDEIPAADVERLSDAHATFLLRAVKKDFEERVTRLQEQKIRDVEAIINPENT
jgi:hypothetical protein